MANRHFPWLKRLVDRVFPAVPDFFGMLADQSARVDQAVATLVRYIDTGDPSLGEEVRREEHAGDVVKARNLQILNESFTTPIDREDIYRAIMSLDDVVNYCKTTVNEMRVLDVAPDAHLAEMAKFLREGSLALSRGFGLLVKEPARAEEEARKARKAERNVEKAYRNALADLFQGTDYISMFKRREIYRHLSNAADHVAHAADTLSDIVVKIS